jgi:hypothetical protein
MKPLKGSSQTATQVKVSSPVIVIVIEADGFRALEGNKRGFTMVRAFFLYRGQSPRYGYEWKVRELGRSTQFPGNGIFADNPKRRGSGNDCVEVGPIRSRGVAG